MKSLLNKHINKVKLTLTTRCNLSCPYCFVKKTDENMGWDVAKKAIDILIKSRGKDKLLSLYGGEPLLNFGLIKKICPYAIDQAKNNNKRLIIAICTNATLLKQYHLDFFRIYDIKIVLSLVGKKEGHDSVRIFKNSVGTYELIQKKVTLLFKTIKRSNLGASFCVLPETVTRLDEHFQHLLKLGLNYINLEIIREYEGWSRDDLAVFYSGYLKIIKHVLSNINKNNFIFINPINWEIKYKLLSNPRGNCCPFNYILEVYPGGDLAFSPFLLNAENKKDYIIGNLKQNEQYRFDSCSFSQNNEMCKNCMCDYSRSYKSDIMADKITHVYRALSLKTSRYIIKKAENNKNYKDYVTRIKKRVCF